MKPFLFVYLLLCWLVPTDGYAATSGSIINVSHSFRMSASEPTPAREYYVDLGTRDGVKVGDILEVTRQLSVSQADWSGPNHLIRVALGEVRIIVVGETASVARLQSQQSAELAPALDYSGFLIGDNVESKSNLPIHSATP